MPEKNLENREKPVNTGVLRFLVYSTILENSKPITPAQIKLAIDATGHIISRRTIFRAIAEIITANTYSAYKLQSKTVHAGDSRARAFYFVTPQNS